MDTDKKARPEGPLSPVEGEGQVCRQCVRSNAFPHSTFPKKEREPRNKREETPDSLLPCLIALFRLAI